MKRKNRTKSVVNTKKVELSKAPKRAKRLKRQSYDYHIRPSVHPSLVSRGSLKSFSRTKLYHGPATNVSQPSKHTTIRLYSPQLVKRKKCKVGLADSARRSAFFKAKHNGGSSRRPEHNRKHKRTC